MRQGGLPGEDFEELGRDIPEGIEAAKILVKAGYDALDVDAGTYDSWYWSHPPMYFEKGMNIPFGEILKKKWMYQSWLPGAWKIRIWPPMPCGTEKPT